VSASAIVFRAVQDPSTRYRLQAVLPARKDGWPDADDVVREVSSATFADEEEALDALADSLGALIEGR